jgi:hypothetical protein
MEIIIVFLSQSTSPVNLTSSYIQWMTSLSNNVYDIQKFLLNQTNNALIVKAGLLHRSHSNITLGIVGEPTMKKR